MAELTAAVGVTRGLMDFAVSQGANREDLIGLSGIDARLLTDPDAHIPFGSYVALMKAAQKLCDDQALALHYAEQVDMSEVSIVGMLPHTCATMMDAFRQISRYNRLVYDGPGFSERWQILPAGNGGLWLQDNRPNPNDFPEATESAFGWMVCGPRLFDRTPFCRAVHVTHAPPSYRSEYSASFALQSFLKVSAMRC